MPDSELGFLRYFAALPDPRVNRTKKRSLSDILGVTLCAVICGADGWDAVRERGRWRQTLARIVQTYSVAMRGEEGAR